MKSLPIGLLSAFYSFHAFPANEKRPDEFVLAWLVICIVSVLRREAPFSPSTDYFVRPSVMTFGSMSANRFS